MIGTRTPDRGKASPTRLWLVMAPTALLILFGFLALIALFLAGARLDREAEDQATVQMQAALKHAGDTLSALAKDNAWWDEAFENTYLDFSEEWVADTWGTGGFSGQEGDVDGLMVLDREGRVLGGYGLNIEITQGLADSMRGLDLLIDSAVKGPSDEPQPVLRWLRTHRGIVLASAVPITPFKQPDVAWNPQIRPVVVVFNRIDGNDFARFERQSGVTTMMLADGLAEGRAGQALVSSVRGNATWLTWQVPMPGQQMVDKFLLPVTLLTLILLGLSFAAGRRILDHERMLSAYALELRDAHGMFRSALQVIDEGFSIARDNRIAFWNAEFLRLTGIAGMTQGDPTRSIRDQILARFEIIDGDRDNFVEQRGPGQWLLLGAGTVLQVRRIDMPDGKMLLVRDVTADREAQQELIDARRDAEHANHIKSKFLAQMSHELRTPLNAILGFSEVISMGLLGQVQPAPYGGYAKDIHAAGRHLLTLVNDVLDLSKIEAGRMEANLESVTLAAIAEDARTLIGAKAEAKNIALTVAGDPALRIKADPKMAKQVLLNLLSNAIKFTPAGGAVNITWRQTESGMAEALVSDTGIGMSQDDLERALTPFGQAKHKTVSDEPGTGLGLPIVTGLCKAQGGSFAIESTPGLGTTAIVRLPADIAA